MVDLIVATDDPKAWHRDNIARNPGHYAASLRLLGASAIARVQEMSAGVYFNTLVPHNDGVLGLPRSTAARSLTCCPSQLAHRHVARS
jgi:mitochondrial translocator assembly and maintenance protein 41